MVPLSVVFSHFSVFPFGVGGTRIREYFDSGVGVNSNSSPTRKILKNGP